MARGITKQYELYNAKLLKDNPMRILWQGNDFSDIQYGEIRIVLSAQSPLPLPLVSWRLTEIRVNGKSFIPHGPTDTRNVIHVDKNLTTGQASLIGENLTNKENVFEIFRDAPLGTGFIFDQVNILVTLTVTGFQETNPTNILTGSIGSIFSKTGNINLKIQDIVKNNLPLAIFLMILVIILLFFVYRIFASAATIRTGVPSI